MNQHALHRHTVADRLHEHRELVLRIHRKTDQLAMLSDRMIRVGGSVIEPSSANPDAITNDIQMIDDLEAEIATLGDTRRIERARLESLSNQLQSDLQRKVIEAYYYYGLPWCDVAMLVYHQNHASDRRNCGEAKSRAISIMEVYDAKVR